MDHIENLVYIGHMAVFYIPLTKLDDIAFGKNGQTPRQIIADFLMEKYDAYTVIIANTQGFWRQHKQSRICMDLNALYEVSFEGNERVPEFVAFLSDICTLLQEDAIYLTMGYRSFLVTPKEGDRAKEGNHEI